MDMQRGQNLYLYLLTQQIQKQQQQKSKLRWVTEKGNVQGEDMAMLLIWWWVLWGLDWYKGRT